MFENRTLFSKTKLYRWEKTHKMISGTLHRTEWYKIHEQRNERCSGSHDKRRSGLTDASNRTKKRSFSILILLRYLFDSFGLIEKIASMVEMHESVRGKRFEWYHKLEQHMYHCLSTYHY